MLHNTSWSTFKGWSSLFVQSSLRFRIILRSLSCFMTSCLLMMITMVDAKAQDIQPPAVLAQIFKPYFIGQGRLQIFIFDVYDIALFSEDPTWSQNRRSALVVNYKMSISKRKLIESTLESFDLQKDYSDNERENFHDYLEKLYDDITADDQLVAVFDPNQGLEIFINDQLINTVDDVPFARAFMDIWLGEKTPEPDLRLQLLGKGNKSL